MISLNVQPCKFQPCPGFYKLPTAVDGIRQESQSLENAAHLSKTAFLALHLLSLSVPTHSTHFTKREPSCQSNFLDFLDWRNYGATWLFQNLALDGFDLVFGSTGALCWCRNANEKFLQSGKHQLSMAVLFVIVWISRTVNTRWEVMRKGVTGSKEVRPAWLCPTKKQLKRPILSQPLQSGSSEEEVSAQQNKDFI